MDLTTFLDQLQGWILQLAGSGWVYPVMTALATIDGFFPPLPSESVIITLAVAARSVGEPWLPGILLTAAVGAWFGDQIAYQIGRSVGTDRIRVLRTRRGREAVAFARSALARRGASFIIAARYVPIGRVAVNMSAGAVGYPRRRFMVFSAIAAAMWAVYSMLIGLAAGAWLEHHPLLAMVVGVVVGVLLGVALDLVVRRVTHRQAARDAAEAVARAAAPQPPARNDVAA
jgi:membrane protein DedA with SNARE-associated domain